MARTYVKLGTTTLTSAQLVVTFSSIPSTYTDLVVIYSGSSVTSGQSLDVRLNSDTGTNYSFTGLYGDGSTASSFKVTSSTYGRIANFTTSIGNAIAYFQNYANTNINKTWLSRSNSAGADVIAFTNLWRSTAAISSISFSNFGNSVNIASGSTFTLYGIKAEV